MQTLASTLKDLPAQVLQHEYDYESFGSWFLTLRYTGRAFRLTLDGRDGIYILEASAQHKRPYRWEQTIWQQEAGAEFPTGAFLDALRDAS